MKISSELLAAYAEGKVSESERNAVRHYLKNHPEELESVIVMMDKDYQLNLQNDSKLHPKNLIESPGHVDLKNASRRLGELLDEIM